MLAWPRLRSAGLTLWLVGALFTVLASFAAVHLGLTIGVGAVAVAVIFLGSVVAYLRVAHLAIAATIP